MVADDVPRLKKLLARRGRVNWRIDEDVRVYHIREWGPAWRGYGLPSILSSISSATRYMSFTAEWVIIQRVLRTYAMMITGFGNNKGLSQVSANYANRISEIFSGAGIGGDTIGNTNMRGTPPVGLAALSGLSSNGLQGMRIDPITDFRLYRSSRPCQRNTTVGRDGGGIPR